jgi:hypothetical protein
VKWINACFIDDDIVGKTKQNIFQNIPNEMIVKEVFPGEIKKVYMMDRW